MQERCLMPRVTIRIRRNPAPGLVYEADFVTFAEDEQEARSYFNANSESLMTTLAWREIEPGSQTETDHLDRPRKPSEQ